MELEKTLPLLLGVAWLTPLASFATIALFGPKLGKAGRGAGLLGIASIVTACVLSIAAMSLWLNKHSLTAVAAKHATSSQHGTTPAGEKTASPETAHGEHAPAVQKVPAISGEWYALGVFGDLRITVGYYIDSLTLAMFTMVTFIASCIHVYSFGYMHEELQDVTDEMVTLSNGQHLRRHGRFYRFYQYLSLFCFSMLGLVISGNVAMVFVFWELVGICSYFLIGFYIERRSAVLAANKAFITNRVGDFGMLIGLMALWTGMGTFSFDDYQVTDAAGHTKTMSGIFSQVRPASDDSRLQIPDNMTLWAQRDRVAEIVANSPRLEIAEAEVKKALPDWRKQGFGYGMLVIAGLGIFCGCVGKSAQFPLHVWLPDAMEGPTPVSALIHAATMVAAGVYLVGRFYPVFTPEVLFVIACIGCVTLFLAATMALTATDIKRVLAFSTVSQLGYMMFALGVGGWIAGLFHLFTHAFFKALLFLCSGSVIHATHTNEMPQMGGLLKKMPYTAITMLIGCLAIAGAGVPFVIGLSGYYSKDAIIAQGLAFKATNPLHGWLFYVAAGGAAMTSFYMFRLWFMTFVGKPRDSHVYEHAHESPKSMTVPLMILAGCSVIAGWNVPFTSWSLPSLLQQSYPAGIETGSEPGLLWPGAAIPAEALSHALHSQATFIAFGMALAGFLLAVAFYGVKTLDSSDAKRTFAPLYWLFSQRWLFDELYQFALIRPALAISRFIAAVDKRGIDWLVDHMAVSVKAVAQLDDVIDRLGVDRVVNLIGSTTHGVGVRLKRMQTGNVRQYVMFLGVGLTALFIVMSWYWNYTFPPR